MAEDELWELPVYVSSTGEVRGLLQCIESLTPINDSKSHQPRIETARTESFESLSHAVLATLLPCSRLLHSTRKSWSKSQVSYHFSPFWHCFNNDSTVGPKHYPHGRPLQDVNERASQDNTRNPGSGSQQAQHYNPSYETKQIRALRWSWRRYT
jgi:hypothetical protein